MEIEKEKRSKTTEFLLKRNKDKSEQFIKPANRIARRFYREKHPTEIAAFKCMDGRLNLPVITKIPEGIVNPFRQIAGVFDLGDPYLGFLIESWINYSIKKVRKCLVLSTYHFSKGDHHRGCAGHKENTVQAIEWAKRLVNQHTLVFGEISERSVVYPIVVGIETDSDSLIFHGSSGEVFNIYDNLSLSEKEIENKIVELYPRMSFDIVKDLLVIILGNIEHVKCIKEKGKSGLDLVHSESIICIGRGFGWLHEPNKALIIGPFKNELFSVEDAIQTAGNIVLKNIKEGRVSKTDGVTVMCSSLFFDEGINRARETIKAYTLYNIARKVLTEKVPELLEYNLEFIVGTTKHDDWLFREIDPTNFSDHIKNNISLSENEKEIIKTLN